ncbi:hypothetical protein HG536_0F03630 [Torulaspora globosa]|uniref:Mitochondrial distribution and morphology protein 10 n=1 Tax=Torulaspora globosa TaxID=48254 RepID=A0A7G3ZKK2_9SACH|nr:uncharacterized protein HG536_0F03630 [Torulaspora globosa]QLL34038.1 hypothetical protein HG536_0F03630 [Torulaspora globosa]
MLDYMESVSRAFEQSTGWSRDNSYANITATSKALLDFKIPTAFEFQVSNATTPYTFNTTRVSTRNIFNGSLTYLYSDADNLKDMVRGSGAVSLQQVTETYRYFQPFYNHKSAPSNGDRLVRKSLYYGRMYYPTSNLEAMMIKRLTPYTQVKLKCLSTFNEFNILTCHWQRDTGRNCQELIFSTNDLLCGYRFLHNFLGTPSKMKTSLYNNSSLSLGTELWLGLITLSPGCSTTLRYCTHAPNTGRPLTLTLSWNPFFGNLSSSYSAKTSTSTTFCAKYDFNLYSIDSNLSFGVEVWRRGSTNQQHEPPTSQSINKTDNLMYHHLLPTLSQSSSHGHGQTKMEHEQQLLQDLTTAFSTSLKRIDREKFEIENFQNDYSCANFTSVWKLSTSLRDKNLKVLWEGKFKGFLVSAGGEFFKSSPLLDNRSRTPLYPARFGVQLQYST